MGNTRNRSPTSYKWGDGQKVMGIGETQTINNRIFKYSIFSVEYLLKFRGHGNIHHSRVSYNQSDVR